MSTSEVMRLANDIAAQFSKRSEQDAATAVAAHIRAFWDPRMRSQLLDLVAAGGGGLDPAVIGAAARLRPAQTG